MSRKATRRRSQRGQSLVTFALTAVVLLAVVGLAVDGGFSYFASDRLERGAMAGALGGVPSMPDFNVAPNDATTMAVAAAAKNGWTSGGPNNVSITVAKVTDPATGAYYNNRLSVTISSDVPVFFMKLLGFTTHREARTAVAEYLRPITFGQPGNQMGSDLSSLGTGNNFFFMRSEGWGTDRSQGDAYGPNPSNAWTPFSASPADMHALNSTTEPSVQPLTPMPARGGQNYQIFIPNGQQGVVQVYNPVFAPDNGVSSAGGYTYHEDDGDFPETGSGCRSGSPGTAPCSGPTNIQQWPVMSYTLYNAPNPFDHSSDTWFSNMRVKSIDATQSPAGNYTVPPSTTALPLAGITVHHGWIDVASTSSPANTLTAADKNLITLNNPTNTDILTSSVPAGTTYRLRADQLDNALGDPGANGRPQNQNSQAHKGYAVRIKPTGTGCTACTVAALDDTTIYTPVKAGGFQMPLVSVPPEYEGRNFSLYVYDPGDVSCIPGGCSNVLSVLRPAGYLGSPPDPTRPNAQVVASTSVANGVSVGGSAEASTFTGITPAAPLTTFKASVQTQDQTKSPANIYNGLWIRFDIAVPTDYSTADVIASDPSTWFWNLSYTTAQAAGDTITANLGFTGAPVHLVTG
jgi:hypothetical protein